MASRHHKRGGISRYAIAIAAAAVVLMCLAEALPAAQAYEYPIISECSVSICCITTGSDDLTLDKVLNSLISKL